MTHLKPTQRFISVLAAMLLFFGGSLAASAAETKTANFNSGLPEGWTLVGSSIYNDDDRARSGKGVWSNGKSDTENYLVTEPVEGSLSLYWRSFGTSSSYPQGYLTVYQYDGTSLGAVIKKTATYKSSTWKSETFDLGDYRGQVAIALYSACIDDVTYTPYQVADTPTLTIDGFTSGSTFNFGAVPVAEGTTQTFVLNNIGLAELLISSIELTGDYTFTAGSDLTSLAPQSSAEVTIATPAADATGTLTIVSNDANSPYTINLESSYRAPAPEMAVNTTAIALGNVTEDVTEEVTVSNTGDDVLQVSISSNNDDFTVSVAELTVEAGETATFTVTYHYDAEAYGLHSGVITLTPNVGEDILIDVWANVKDPNVWSEDFEGNALPIGWTTDTNWTFDDGVAHSQYTYGTTGHLTTPVLTVVEGESMTFQYRATANNVRVKIDLSKNGGEFTDFRTTDWVNTMDEFATFTIDGLETGSYQFRFASDDYDLDNFEGFHLNQNAPVLAVDPATDAAFGKVTEQPEAKTYTITNEGTGTLTGTISSSDAAFSVSVSEFSLEAGESLSFDIELVLDGVYGKKEGVITIHPTNEGLSDVVINASATLLDPSLWTEDFDEGVLPDGWATTGWSVGTNANFEDTTPMPLAPNSTTPATLTTPRLQALEGDVLTWDAYLRWEDEVLLVEYSDDDQATWNTLYSYKSEDEGLGNNAHKEMSFTAPADGTYQLRFSARFQTGVDNFNGFALAPSEAVRETWYVSYTFHYPDELSEWQTVMDTEEMEVELDGNNVSFNFPNPINGNAWMKGSFDEDGNIYFPSGQYIASFGTESAYYCGFDSEALTDFSFTVNETGDSYLCMTPILINSSTTSVAYWFYFSTVVVSKEEPAPDAIDTLNAERSMLNNGEVYDLQGRKVTHPTAGHLYIVNGRKVLMK